METVLVPNLKETTGLEIFRRAEVFANLSVKFTSNMKLGVDQSLKTMKTLLGYQPVQGLTIMNELLNSLKDVILTFQYNNLMGNQQYHVPCPMTTPPAEITKYKMFSKDDMTLIDSLHRDLFKIIFEHQAIMEKLGDANVRHSIQRKKMDTLVAVAKELIAKHKNAKQGEGDALLKRKAKGNTESHMNTLEKVSKKRHAELLRENNTTLKALMRHLVFLNKEKERKNLELKIVEDKLRSLVEYRITQALSLGRDHLLAFAKKFSLPQHVTKKLTEFEAPHAANKLYQQLSTRYSYPDAQSCSAESDLPDFSWKSHVLQFQHKHASHLGKSASYVDRFSKYVFERRQEELYVCSRVNTKQQNNPNMLKFSKDQKIKQKCCSSDGKVAFGWKGHLAGGMKTYGFYPTQYVSPVS